MECQGHSQGPARVPNDVLRNGCCSVLPPGAGDAAECKWAMLREMRTPLQGGREDEPVKLIAQWLANINPIQAGTAPRAIMCSLWLPELAEWAVAVKECLPVISLESISAASEGAGGFADAILFRWDEVEVLRVEEGPRERRKPLAKRMRCSRKVGSDSVSGAEVVSPKHRRVPVGK